MNAIIENLIKDFLTNEEIKSSSDSVNFENFCNFSIISNEYSGDFSIEDISMGAAQGIDGLAILANGNIVTTTQEIDDLVNRNKFLEVSFIFIQTKTSSSFDGADISNFFVSINDFLSDKPKLIQTTEIQKAITLKNKVWGHVSKMKGQPTCKVYYVTTGKWSSDPSLMSRIDNHKSDLINLSLFRKIDILVYGADEIQDSYLRTKRNTSCEFTFGSHIVLPVEKDVREAYFGIVKFEEFKKIISDRDSIKDVFYENIRDFLGESNVVNLAIETTLKKGEFDIFCLLNNGVTIVADSKTNTGNKFFIENYQIVNGCQTSHVLFNNKEIVGIEKINIPLKLIITDNEEIRSKIIVATNSQTSIPKEQLEAFQKFQKNLELFYGAKQEDNTQLLFYERRQKQYRDKNISRPHIVTIREQIKTFASMFLDAPHLASGYFSKVYANKKEQMFMPDHKSDTYYISSLAMYKLEYFFKKGLLDKKYRSARYHILMIFRILMNQLNHISLPLLNSKEIEKYCKKIETVLLDDKKAVEYFEKSIGTLKSINSINIDDQKTLYLLENTEALKQKLNEDRKSV